MSNIDISLAGSPKPERGGFAAFFMLICVFCGPIGWGICIAMWMNLNEEVKEWERQQELAAILNRDS
jgi:hypothetical protein